MIDTHAHIYLPEFETEIHNILDRAFEVGITDIYLPAINLGSLDQMKKLPKHSIRLHKMIGIHPCDIKGVENEFGSFDVVMEKMSSIAQKESFCAIGEIGLDYYWDDSNKANQKAAFSKQMEFAKSENLPIVIHNRNSTDDMLELVSQQQDGSLKGVWHCFNGTIEEGRRAIDLGLYLGIGGVLTFKNAGVDKTVVELPMERLLLETDSPYLAPVPNRGRRNYPEYVKIICERLGQIKGISSQKIAFMTSQNAQALFGGK